MASPRPERRTTARQARDVTINLRAKSAQRVLIDRAAAVLGRNRSEFVLDVVCREAESVLLDRRLFTLDAKAYRRFTAALDAPPSENPRLRRLLAKRAPWE
jgi:uncharacterized protein (DUF1778 family)